MGNSTDACCFGSQGIEWRLRVSEERGGETKKGVLVLRGVAAGIIAIRWRTDSLRGVRSGKVGEQGNEDQKGFSFSYGRDSRSFPLLATMIK